MSRVDDAVGGNTVGRSQREIGDEVADRAGERGDDHGVDAVGDRVTGQKNPKRATWRNFRELWIPKWSGSFVDAIEARTGERAFTYRIAVTKLRGDAAAWATDETIARNLPGCDVGFITLEEMWNEVLQPPGDGSTKPAPSEIGRLSQLLKAAGLA